MPVVRKKSSTLPVKAPARFTGTVRRIVPHVEEVWAQIIVQGADSFYNEIRVPRQLQNEDGTTTSLRLGDHLTVTIARAAKA